MQFLKRYTDPRFCKFYTIKLAVDLAIARVPRARRLYTEWGGSQLLYSFFVATVVNNMFHSRRNVNSKYRNFLCSVGMSAYKTTDECPLQYDGKCYMHSSSVSCSEDARRRTKDNVMQLLSLYLRLYGVLEFVRALPNARRVHCAGLVAGVAESAARSTTMLAGHCLVYRAVLCYMTQMRGGSNVMDSQTACVIGSLCFGIERRSRRRIINKYLTCLYLDSVTSQIGIGETPTQHHTMQMLFGTLLAVSVCVRGPISTCVSLLG